MSELIDNSKKRRKILKNLILHLHEGEAPDVVKRQLRFLLGRVPYNEVVEVEQELISEGLPQEEILRLCDIHSDVLKGSIDQKEAKTAPPGHPVHTFIEENRAINRETAALSESFYRAREIKDAGEVKAIFTKMATHFRALTDVEKHYRRKENLLFPFLEEHGIEGPPTVMWGKHDEIRELLKKSFEILFGPKTPSPEEARSGIENVLKPFADAVEEMIFKEENILFPMCLDTLSEADWYEIYQQGPEIGFCLYDPREEWKPQYLEAGAKKGAPEFVYEEAKIRLPSGSFIIEELEAVLDTLPMDITFVGKDDTVHYFNQARDRIFTRTRAILGRKVQNCHPPGSVHIVEQILSDFKTGKRNSASFWIDSKGKFIHIEYLAVRGKNGEYLGTLEATQDLTEKRKLQGEQRLISYGENRPAD